MNNDFTSHAVNFNNMLKTEVNPRTLQFEVSLPVFSIIGNNHLGPELHMALNYSPLSDSNYGFGKGFSLNFTHIVRHNSILELSNGEKYKIEWGTDKVINQKIKNFKFSFTNGINIDKGYTIDWKDGTKEYIEHIPYSNIWAVTKIVSPIGKELYLSWIADWDRTTSPSKSFVKLSEIRDSHHLLCKVNYNDRHPYIIFWPESNEKYEIDFQLDLNHLLQNMTLMSHNEKLSWNFEYDDIFVDLYPKPLLNKISYPTGMIEEVDYDYFEGFRIPSSSNSYLPCVFSHTIHPGGSQPAISRGYFHSKNNFLGFGGSFPSSSSKDKDNMEEKLVYYTYHTREVVRISGSTSMYTTRIYNNYHLLISEEVEFDGISYLTEIEYYALNNTFTVNQPPQFQLPKKKKETWKVKSTGKSRTQITETEFDDYGNPIKQIDPDGTVSEIIWYKASGETGCPKDINGFTRFMKEKKVYSISSMYAIPTYSTKYTYENLNNQNSIALKTQSEYADNKIFSKKEYFYNNSSNSERGRITQIEETIYSLTNSTESYVSKQIFSTKVENNKLYQTVVFKGYDGLESTNEKITSLYRGSLLYEKDSKGFESEYIYDSLGRILTRTSFPKTTYEKRTQWKYSSENGFNITTETDNEGNSSKIYFDGFGREIKNEILDKDNGSVWREISSKSYNYLGELISTKSIDWDPSQSNKQYTNIEEYTYNEWKQLEETSSSNGIKKVNQIDPISLTSIFFKQTSNSSNILKSGSVTEQYNSQGLIISKTLKGTKNENLSVSRYFYDGLKRLREEQDPLGRSVKYDYDILNRVSKVTLDDYTFIYYTYAPHSKGALITSITVENNNSQNQYLNYAKLGTQEFDSLGRLKNQTVGGRKTQYKYEKDSNVPYLTITPDGNEIQYKNIHQLGDVISEIKTKDITQNFNFDPKKALPLSAKDSKGFESENTWNISGTLKSESYTNSLKEKKTSHHKWTLLGKPSLYTDYYGKDFKYIRNEFGEIIKIEDSSLIVNLTYTNLKQLSSQKVQNRNSQEFIETSFQYDDFNNEIERVIKNNKGSLLKINQTWNKNNQIVTKRTQHNNTKTKIENFEYDNRNRLTKYSIQGDFLPVDGYNKPMTEQSYTYDIVNNIRSVTTKLKDGSQNITTFLYGNKEDVTQLTSLENTHSSYPSKITLKYDANGRMILDEAGRSLSYDSLGRLNTISLRSNIKVNYSYDALNRISSQNIIEGNSYNLYYRGNELINQTIGSDKKEARMIKLNSQCLGVSFENKLTLTGTDEKSNLVYSYKQSESNENIHSWSSYGSSETSFDTLLGFNGERRDPFTGNYHLGNGYRSYSPVLMRFTSPDSLSPFGKGGINPYSYCSGDPINKTDPSGHISWQGWLGIVCGTIGLGIALISGIGAIVSIGGVIAAFNSASAASLIIGGLGVASDITAIASGACESLNPQASSVLGWVSLGTGLAGLAGSMTNSYLGARAAKAKNLSIIANATREETMVKDIQRIDEEFYIFDTTASNGGKKLNISAHGVLEVDGTALLSGGSRLNDINPSELFETIQNYRNIEEYDQIRLGMCYSANGGENSFAQQLSNLSGKPVRGYKGSVYTHLGNAIENEIEYLVSKGISETVAEETALSSSEKFPYFAYKENTYHPFQKDFWLFNYKPVSFNPTTAV